MEASEAQQRIESLLQEVAQRSGGRVLRIVSTDMRQLYDDRMLLSAVLVSVRDLDGTPPCNPISPLRQVDSPCEGIVPASLYRSLAWLVQGGRVAVCDVAPTQHLPLIWRSMFEAFGKQEYRMVARSPLCVVYEKLPAYPHDRGVCLLPLQSQHVCE